MTAKEKVQEIKAERDKAQAIMDNIIKKYPAVAFHITNKPKANRLSLSINMKGITNDNS